VKLRTGQVSRGKHDLQDIIYHEKMKSKKHEMFRAIFRGFVLWFFRDEGGLKFFEFIPIHLGRT